MYMNFRFSELKWDENNITGLFTAVDNNVSCRFSYDRITEATEIWDNNKSEDEILPLPMYWLCRKLNVNGTLRETEIRICC